MGRWPLNSMDEVQALRKNASRCGFFTKLHESCCDARTALDLLKLPGVTRLEEVPCVAAVEGC